MKRENVVWGIILILLGVGFLVYQLNPGLFGGFRWPWIIVALGAIFTLGSLIGRVGGPYYFLVRKACTSSHSPTRMTSTGQ